uniref:Uncharacterized protein n=1 Tax=Aegilops tauschii subsp. strangulata TaxID=200361 RepID=A0A453GTP7_AEGTS
PMDAAAGGHRWTEEVDDLVDAGDVDGAISLLESVVSSLSTAAPSPPPAGADLRLATALGDLAGLHASRGNTLQADAIRSRAIVLRLRAEKEAPRPQALGFVPPPIPSSVLASEPNLGLLDLDLPIWKNCDVFSVNSSSF